VFSHLWNPPLLEETRLIVVAETEMTPAEVKDAVVRSGRALAGGVWIKQVEPDEFEEPESYEAPEDYLLIGVLPPTSAGVMPVRPTERDPTFDYPFEMRP
jgi:hypothetical protein